MQLLIPAAAALAAEFFPSLIGKLAGDRAEQVAEQVVKTAAQAAGLPETAEVDEIAARLKADREADTRARLAFAMLDQAEHARILADREAARARDAKLQEDGRPNRRADVMLGLAFLGLLACIALVVAPTLISERTLDPAEIALVTTVAGALLKMISDAFAFEFGSSKGSRSKDRQIEDIQRALVEVAGGRHAGAEVLPALTAGQPAAAGSTPAQPAPAFVDRLIRKQL